MPGTLAPNPVLQVFDTDGNPLPGAQLFTFASGTSTPRPVYHDAALAVPWTNPAIADAGGFFISLYMGAESQSWILKDQFGVTQWSVDPVQSVGLTGSGGDVFEVFVFGGDSTSPVTSPTYPSGSTMDKTHAGTSMFQVDPSNIPAGTYVLQAMILEAGGALVEVAIVDLGAGSPDTPIGTASGSGAVTGVLVNSNPITFPAGGATHGFGIKVRTAAGAAFIWGVKLTRSNL